MDPRPPSSRIADIVFIITCVFLSAAAGYRLLPTHRAPEAGAGLETALVGRTVSLPEVDSWRAPSTVLVIVSSTCRFCTESAPFYRQLVEAQRRAGARWDLVFVGVEDNDVIAAYLKGHGIEGPPIARLTPALGIRGTPTLLVVDRAGTITRALAGKLSAGQERDTLSSLAD